MKQLLDLLEKHADSLGVGSEAVRQLRGIVEQGLVATERRFEADRSASERLLAHVSHELRTPLTPALLAICLLQRDRTLSPEVQTELTVIRRSIEQEARLIDNLIEQAAFVEAATDARMRIA